MFKIKLKYLIYLPLYIILLIGLSFTSTKIISNIFDLEDLYYREQGFQYHFDIYNHPALYNFLLILKEIEKKQNIQPHFYENIRKLVIGSKPILEKNTKYYFKIKNLISTLEEQDKEFRKFESTIQSILDLKTNIDNYELMIKDYEKINSEFPQIEDEKKRIRNLNIITTNDGQIKLFYKIYNNKENNELFNKDNLLNFFLTNRLNLYEEISNKFLTEMEKLNNLQDSMVENYYNLHFFYTSYLIEQSLYPLPFKILDNQSISFDKIYDMLILNYRPKDFRDVIYFSEYQYLKNYRKIYDLINCDFSLGSYDKDFYRFCQDKKNNLLTKLIAYYYVFIELFDYEEKAKIKTDFDLLPLNSNLKLDIITKKDAKNIVYNFPKVTYIFFVQLYIFFCLSLLIIFVYFRKK